MTEKTPLTLVTTHDDNCHFTILLKDGDCLKEEEGRLCSCGGWEKFKSDKVVKKKKKIDDDTMFAVFTGGLLTVIVVIMLYASIKSNANLSACKRACAYRYVRINQTYPVLTCICLNDKGLEFEKEVDSELKKK